MKQSVRGFTLIELMIAVAIVGILVAIAYPSYMGYVRDTRRGTAQGCLVELAQYMERYYTTKMTYVGAALPQTTCTNDMGDFYTFGFNGNVTASAFSIQAAPKGAQATDSCGTLRLNEQGSKTKTGSGTDCW